VQVDAGRLMQDDQSPPGSCISQRGLGTSK